MGYHHVAVTTVDLPTTHRFYTEACGFTLAKVEAAPTPEGGWARHVFYDTGDGPMFAVWDIHSEQVGRDHSTAISTGLGWPEWANHIAFSASDLDDIRVKRERWYDHGCDVLEIDHGWCTSIYTRDPNGVLVEFCTSTREFTDADRAEAEQQLFAEMPELDLEPPGVQFFLHDA
jgi:catechol 2,3-dioxygenase-like lactoylglutathione lyase family enzyme